MDNCKYKPKLKHSELEELHNGEYLEHFGIKGMKWGKRKTPAQKAARKAAKDKARLKKYKEQVARSDARFERRYSRAKARVEVKQLKNELRANKAHTKELKERGKSLVRADKMQRRKEQEDRRRFDIQTKQNAKREKEQSKERAKTAMIQAKAQEKKDQNITNVNYSHKDYKHMSDTQLREVLNRIEMENKFKTLKPVPPTFLQKVARNADTVMPVVSMFKDDKVAKTVFGKPMSDKAKNNIDMINSVLNVTQVLRKKK